MKARRVDGARRRMRRLRIEAMDAAAAGQGDGCGGWVRWGNVVKVRQFEAIGAQRAGVQDGAPVNFPFVCAAVPFLSGERKGKERD